MDLYQVFHEADQMVDGRDGWVVRFYRTRAEAETHFTHLKSEVGREDGLGFSRVTIPSSETAILFLLNDIATTYPAADCEEYSVELLGEWSKGQA